MNVFPTNTSASVNCCTFQLTSTFHEPYKSFATYPYFYSYTALIFLPPRDTASPDYWRINVAFRPPDFLSGDKMFNGFCQPPAPPLCLLPAPGYGIHFPSVCQRGCKKRDEIWIPPTKNSHEMPEIQWDQETSRKANKECPGNSSALWRVFRFQGEIPPARFVANEIAFVNGTDWN